MLLLSPSFLVPRLNHDGLKVWDTLAIAEYLHEINPEAGLAAGRSGAARPLPLDLRRDAFRLQQSALGAADESQGAFPGFKAWAGARGDIDRITTIWRECLGEYKGPYLFGAKPCAADAMYAPVCTRFLTYDVAIDPVSAEYCRAIMALPHMQEWIAAAKLEPDELEELDVEF